MKKKTQSISLRSFLFLALSVFLFACSKEKAVTEVQPESDKLVSYLETLGFKKENVQLKGDTYIIDGDVLITKAELAKRAAAADKSDGSPDTEHWRGTYIISNTYNSNVRLYIDPAVPAAWRTAIQGAVANWNAINGTRLGMSIVTSQANSDTRVFMGFESASWIARAYLPSSNRRPGVSIEINSNYNSLAASQKLFAITHELGHTIGFYHTNQNQGVFIQGTPSVDANSVMNSFVLPWNGFTAGDVLATQILYPQ
ncbi:M57 family metalloprotease [Chitinophaga rhizophila]|uniref:Zinc-dependent metalloprotease n=1 Tax=Chitinophaga rhizophila TaxID=2866212 RepID=A0ABS7GJD0_9BACT|nr:M57 family metalloprotease [Chitinophaga rhizophila]MBW8687819.1 zinc-dependent metalloprotease [Chitinophaga rhizophila]